MTDTPVTDTPALPATLLQRLVKLRTEIDNIPKGGTAPADMGGYGFIKYDDVAAQLGTLFAKHGIVVLPDMPEAPDITEVGKTRNGAPIWRSLVHIIYTFYNSDNAEDKVCCNWWGEGMDSGDKSIQKAGTSSSKFLLLKALQLAGAADSESDTNEIAAAADYGSCPRPGCKGNIIRKSRKGGADMAVCSTSGYKNGKSTGCPWIDWEPDFDDYEQRAAAPPAPATPAAPAPETSTTVAAGEQQFAAKSPCPYCLDQKPVWLTKSQSPSRFASFPNEPGGLLCTGIGPNGSPAGHRRDGSRYTPPATVADPVVIDPAEIPF